MKVLYCLELIIGYAFPTVLYISTIPMFYLYGINPLNTFEYSILTTSCIFGILGTLSANNIYNIMIKTRSNRVTNFSILMLILGNLGTLLFIRKFSETPIIAIFFILQIIVSLHYIYEAIMFKKHKFENKS